MKWEVLSIRQVDAVCNAVLNGNTVGQLCCDVTQANNGPGVELGLCRQTNLQRETQHRFPIPSISNKIFIC